MATILVVDDDKSVQEMLKDLLTRQGYEVHTCRDGKQVMPELGRHRYDLVILDVLIPHMNGFVLMEEIRADVMLRELPVIMISGIYRSRNHRADMTTRYNVIDYLDKPLSTDRLLALVDRVMAGDKAPNREIIPSTLPELPAVSPKKLVLADLDQELALLLPPEDAAAVHDEPVALVKPRTKPARVSNKLIDTAAKNEKKEVEHAARQSFGTASLLLQGSIAKLPAPAVLGRLWRERASGGLLLRREHVKKIVLLREGNPSLIKSNLVSECLGQILLKERLINKTQCEQSVETMKQTGQRQGEILVQMGALTQKNLSFALDLQLETKLFETFTWEAGEYRFSDAVDLPPADNDAPWLAPTVVVEGIRRTFDGRRLEELFSPILGERLDFGEESVDSVEAALTEGEQQVIATLGLPKRIADVIGRSALPKVELMRLVYALITLGILRSGA